MKCITWNLKGVVGKASKQMDAILNSIDIIRKKLYFIYSRYFSYIACTKFSHFNNRHPTLNINSIFIQVCLTVLTRLSCTMLQQLHYSNCGDIDSDRKAGLYLL